MFLHINCLIIYCLVVHKGKEKGKEIGRVSISGTVTATAAHHLSPTAFFVELLV
jgi:hypothetical protein